MIGGYENSPVGLKSRIIGKLPQPEGKTSQVTENPVFWEVHATGFLRPDYFLLADNFPRTQANGSSMSVLPCSQW
jgi:hypothetical protein